MIRTFEGLFYVDRVGVVFHVVKGGCGRYMSQNLALHGHHFRRGLVKLLFIFLIDEGCLNDLNFLLVELLLDTLVYDWIGAQIPVQVVFHAMAKSLILILHLLGAFGDHLTLSQFFLLTSSDMGRFLEHNVLVRESALQQVLYFDQAIIL